MTRAIRRDSMTNMLIAPVRRFEWVWNQLHDELFYAPEVHMGQWQSQSVQQTTYELQNVTISFPIWNTVERNQAEYEPNLPWAEDHFLERVSGEPLNPPPSEAWWPYAQQGNAEHKSGQIFSHTYPERMWPKWAGPEYEEMASSNWVAWEPMRGVRFEYGDLADVVQMLAKDPSSRQAFLPIWFPEDTGAAHGERVPCTLGYHFLLRKQLNVTYFIRSCDFFRHFRDDAYMAARLGQWMVEQLSDDKVVGDLVPYKPYETGHLTMHIVSLHMFEPDKMRMRPKF